MFTVVVTEQVHLDSLEEYKPYLLPFLNRAEVNFCRWNPEGETLPDAVPELLKTVAHREQWRLIVVCGEEGLRQKNPFDIVRYQKPERTEEMDQEAYLAQVRRAKFAAFAQAARQPLTRLMTWLCESPLVTAGRNNAQMDPEFAEYMAEILEKQRLRQEIREGEKIDFALPQEIVCIARRCYQKSEDDLKICWTPHNENEYSRFYDWNLYFDKMRYLIFDTLPPSHTNYCFDYIRFLYSLALLAYNEAPQSALKPNRVYTYSCETDAEALHLLLSKYDSKLSNTQDTLEYDCNRLRSDVRPRLSDRDAQKIFCSSTSIPVENPTEFDVNSLYISGKHIGLSTDHPEDEEIYWHMGYKRSRHNLIKYLKTPARSLKKASSDLHRLKCADLEFASRLNDFQMEDVADYVAEEEMQMIRTHTPNFRNTDAYDEDMDRHDREIRKVIDRRMTGKWTWILLGTVLALYGLSFLSMLIGNQKTTEGMVVTMEMALICVAILGLVALITILCFRIPLKKGIKGYNAIIRTIIAEMDHSMMQFSAYLGHACNVMRGYSVLNFRREHEHPDDVKIQILKKHIFDIRRKREELRETFGTYVSELTYTDEEPYPYDYSRTVDYDYPVPYRKDQRRYIEFMQKGNQIEVPVDFVRRLTVRREELYD